ncbi:GTP-binding protein [Streptomyces qinglanensis]|uniref:Elongation factor Tu n=1 Tax=Streptomyces qinglanensis TaxID=943816 RepID=A0A1H9RFI0_9ACTN|nr:GTP-binding protein [Streptomyces qinglanensis]SER71516.1 elongation factor Tu [Streptomyces qinglanensis]
MSGLSHPRTAPFPVPHLTLGTLGHSGHGKTTLAAALAAHGTGAAPRSPEPGPEPGPATAGRPDGHPAARGQRLRCFRYTTGTRRYTVLDPALRPEPGTGPRPGGGPAVRVRAGDCGARSGLDGALLVVSVREGVRPGTAEQLALARRGGLAHLVVALTMADAGSDGLSERVERQVRTLLAAHGFAAENLPAVRVSARRALDGDPRWTGSIEALLDAVDTYVPLPERAPRPRHPGTGVR